ncbi:MAG: RhuM family protein [Candidatus Thermochlorobacter sp.]
MDSANNLLIYQTENGAIEVKPDATYDTIWANLEQISRLFGRDKSVISRHIKNIFAEGELNREVVVAFFATTHKHGAIEGKQQVKNVAYYNLDLILSVGYRVNSKVATKFRQWATQVLKQHILQGYTINAKVLEQNKTHFLQTLEDLKLLTQNNAQIEAKDVIALIQNFSHTFFSLDSYDKNAFPVQGTLKEIKTSAQELYKDIQQLKAELIKKGEATELFAQEKNKGALEGIFGNVFQSVFGEDAYPTLEDKAAHLLYFIVKNHPFNDGNKRCGAFSFVWLLHKAGYDFKDKVSPQALTTLTLLVAESNPTDKEKMIGIVKLLLNSKEDERF